MTIAAERRSMQEADFLEFVHTMMGDIPIVLSAIGVTELIHGCYRASSLERAMRRRAFVESLIHDLPVLDYTAEVAMLAGRIDGEQRALGFTIPFPDLLIGATALNHGFAILTLNLRHFRMIPGLTVIPFQPFLR